MKTIECVHIPKCAETTIEKLGKKYGENWCIYNENIKNEISINNEKIRGVQFWHQAPGLMKNNPYKNYNTFCKLDAIILLHIHYKTIHTSKIWVLRKKIWLVLIVAKINKLHHIYINIALKRVASFVVFVAFLCSYFFVSILFLSLILSINSNKYQRSTDPIFAPNIPAQAETNAISLTMPYLNQ